MLTHPYIPCLTMRGVVSVGVARLPVTPVVVWRYPRSCFPVLIWLLLNPPHHAGLIYCVVSLPSSSPPRFDT